MTTVFIAGSISISRLHAKVQERINKIVSSNFDVVVGDADGADTSIQECLLQHRAHKVTVYCSGDTPRNNVAGWPVHKVKSKAKVGTRAYFTAKDREMARSSDYGLMIWDCKSTGTLSNIIDLLTNCKKSIVFVNKNSEFVTIANRDELDDLLSLMSINARIKAEKKIGLSSVVANLGQDQLLLAPMLPLADLSDAGAPTPTTTTAETVSTAPIFSAKTLKESSITETEKTATYAQNMQLRTALISALKEHISRTQLSQSQAAKVFGVTQPRISDLNREKVELFGLDALVNMAAAAGLQVEMRVYGEKPS